MKRLTVFCFGVLAVGFVALLASRAASARKAGANRQFQPAGYTLVQVEKQILKSGEIPLTATVTRYVASDGQWEQIRQASDKDGGLSTSQLFGTTKGTFVVRGDSSVQAENSSGKQATLQFVSSWLPPEVRRYSDQYYRSSPSFLKEEEILGYKAYVWRDSSNPEFPGCWGEYSFIPQLGQVPVRMVLHNPESTLDFEPVYIELREPAPGFLRPPNLPESYDIIHHMQDDADKSGQAEHATFLRTEEEAHKRSGQ